jgi:hypothetical protein
MFPEHHDTASSCKPEDEDEHEHEPEPEPEPEPEHEDEPEETPTLEKEIQLYVEKEEIKKLKKPMNMTFKTYNKKSCKKYSSKNYDSNGR